jgi:WD40 repeat protein
MACRAVLLLLFLVGMIGIATAQEIEIEIDSQTGTAYGLAWSPDGTVLAVASGHELTLHDADLETILATTNEAESDASFLNVAWKPDGTQLATVSGFRNPEILIWGWDGEALELLTILDGNAASIASEYRAAHQYGVTWGEAGLISLADDQMSLFQIWDVDAETVTDLHDPGYVDPLYAFTWVPDTDTPSIVGAGQEEAGERTILFAMNAAEGSSKTLFPLLEGASALGFKDDYTFAAVADAVGGVSIIDMANGSTIHTFSSLAQPVGIDWYDDQLAILSYEDGLQIWDLSGELP